MNPDFGKAKAILFDSGHTLNKPSTGQWFIPPKYNEIIAASKINLKSFRGVYAMIRARIYLDRNHSIKDENEEYELFCEFYRIMLKKAGYSPITEEVINALAYDIVYNDNKFIFFDDVEPAINKLKGRYKLGILSDTWPSLERVYRNIGLRDCFQSFVMSSVHGITKSDKRLFQIAINEIGTDAGEIIFVDDSEKNLAMARKVGMVPVKINRYGHGKGRSAFREIGSLEELLQLVGL